MICFPCSVRRLIEWLPRKWRSRGFGVQSPTDYEFLRHVLRERWPYYGYAGAGPVARLCLRLANRVQAERAYCTDDYARYVAMGCHRTQFAATPAGCKLVVADGYVPLDGLPEGAIVLTTAMGEAWRRMAEEPRATIAFDAIDVGIIIIDSSRYPQHYKIML